MSKELEKDVYRLGAEYALLSVRLGRKKTKANQERLAEALKRWEDAKDDLAAEQS